MPIIQVGFRGPRGTPGTSGLPTGTQGQVLGYGAGGAIEAVTLPPGTLPAGTAGQLLGYGEGGVPAATSIIDCGTFN